MVLRLRENDTIVAVATPPGSGGVGIVRLSGPETSRVGVALLRKPLPAPRCATLMDFHDVEGQKIDRGLVLWFPSPHSFTGEDVLELQGHGGPVLLQWLQKACTEAGARLAEPGEFTLRAFLNQKMDLLQAEATADLIAAQSESAMKNALRNLDGEFSNWVRQVAATLLELRLFVEATLDFSDEALEWLSQEGLQAKLFDLHHQLEQAARKLKTGRLVQEGLRIAILGHPNVGKSSLINALAGAEVAIVSDEPGTTRDSIREQLTWQGMTLHLVDTAGIREGAGSVEKQGIQRAWKEGVLADEIWLVIDALEWQDCPDKIELKRKWCDRISEALQRYPSPHGFVPMPLIRWIVNKIDLVSPTALGEVDSVFLISVKEKKGLAEFQEACLQHWLQGGASMEGAWSARARHTSALQEALEQIQIGVEQLKQGAVECLAEHLRLAHKALVELTGELHSDDLLGHIFSHFCIGK